MHASKGLEFPVGHSIEVVVLHCKSHIKVAVNRVRIFVEAVRSDCADLPAGEGRKSRYRQNKLRVSVCEAERYALQSGKLRFGQSVYSSHSHVQQTHFFFALFCNVAHTVRRCCKSRRKVNKLFDLLEELRFYSRSASVSEVVLKTMELTQYQLYVQGLPNKPPKQLRHTPTRYTSLYGLSNTRKRLIKSFISFVA